MVDVHLNWLNWLNWFLFRFLEEGLIAILIDCLIFVTINIDVTRMSMSTVSFLEQIDFRILCLLNAFLWPMIWHLFTVGLSLKRFLVCFNLFLLLFRVTPCLVAALQSCMEWIPIKKREKVLSHGYNNSCSIEHLWTSAFEGIKGKFLMEKWESIFT